jgi:3-oxoacyl-[acyl-carrier-protein] synthase-1
MTVYIGAEHIISPLGNSAEENFANACKGQSGISLVKNGNFKKDTNLYLAKFDDNVNIDAIINDCFNSLNITKLVLKSDKTKIIFSSTKGYISSGIKHALIDVVNRFTESEKITTKPIIISSACISGVVAIAKAAELIKANFYDNVIVIGIDFLSDFVVYGFEALYALSKEICKPFDKDRIGINLGEACSAVVLSKDESIFNQSPLKFVSGSSSNDANHISGPSRTGEGLYRSIQKTIASGNISTSDIGYISAHGTGTKYNDTMEAIAFNRLGLGNVKLNSLKGYFGHTLGAAGLVEVSMSMQQLRHQKVLKSLGYSNSGEDEDLNIITKTESYQFDAFLKTASGFGGGNASIIIRK